RHVVRTQPGPGTEHLVGRADLEGAVVEAAALELAGAADQRHAVMVGVAAHEHHAARHHRLGIAIADLQPQHLGVEAHRRLEIADVQHHVADLLQLELTHPVTSNARATSRQAPYSTSSPASDPPLQYAK